MFENNERIRKMVEKLYAVTEKLDRGDILTREMIQEVACVEPNTAHWQHIVKQVRIRTRNIRNISMMAIRGVGFGLCTIEQQLELGPYRQRRASRQLGMGRKDYKALRRETNLSAHEKQVLAFRDDSLKLQRQRLERDARCRAALEAQPDAMPLPRRPLEIAMT